VSTLAEVRDAEYDRRLEVTRLRRLVYGVPDPTDAGDLLAALAQAEAALRDVEEERVRLQSSPGVREGVILDNGGRARVMGIETTGIEASVTLRMSHVPTAIAHLLDASEHPLVTCEVRNARNVTRRLRVTSVIERYSSPAIDTLELKANVKEEISQLPILHPLPPGELNEMTRATLTVMIEDLDGPVELHRSASVWLLPRTSAPMAVRDPATGGWNDVTPYFGAFVTPNAPAIMRFLRIAADRHPDRSLAGYQGDRDTAVEPQVRALYDALKSDADITYVNSVVTFTPEEGFADQRVRLPRQSLEERQANCIDATVLFASLLEAISLNAALVIVPGHALVAWESWGGSGEWRHLETTMIGSADFDAACASGDATAARYEDRDRRRWPLRELRAQRRITPME
jgi:hypothetical protein